MLKMTMKFRENLRNSNLTEIFNSFWDLPCIVLCENVKMFVHFNQYQ